MIPGALHGVKSAVVTAGPQTAGLSSGARGPPFRWILSSLNGGLREFSRHFVVSCPVAGFASRLPGDLEVDARVRERARATEFQIELVEVAVERVLFGARGSGPRHHSRSRQSTRALHRVPGETV